MIDKPYREMNELELRLAFNDWKLKVEKAAGWSSAYFAAQELAQICRIGGFDNPYPIIGGGRLD